MRFLSLLILLALLPGACGPGAANHSPVPNADAEFDFARGVMWQRPSRLGASLEGEWRCTGPCAANAPAMQDTPTGELRSTFGPGGDADTGAVIWTGKIPAGVSTIAVPITRGPADFSPLVQVSIDFGPIFDLLHSPGNWRYWRVHVKRSGGDKTITVRATENGKSAGEWVALGTPRAVD